MPRKPSSPRTAARTLKAPKTAEAYAHPDQTVLMRPEVGTQPNFRKKKPPVTYRYDSSLSPSLQWDGHPGAREIGEWLIDVIAQAAKLDPPHVLPYPAESGMRPVRCSRPSVPWTRRSSA